MGRHWNDFHFLDKRKAKTLTTKFLAVVKAGLKNFSRLLSVTIIAFSYCTLSQYTLFSIAITLPYVCTQNNGIFLILRLGITQTWSITFLKMFYKYSVFEFHIVFIVLLSCRIHKTCKINAQVHVNWLLSLHSLMETSLKRTTLSFCNWSWKKIKFSWDVFDWVFVGFPLRKCFASCKWFALYRNTVNRQGTLFSTTTWLHVTCFKG